MALSKEVISQFVKLTNDTPKKDDKETITYGTVAEVSGDTVYIKLDGAGKTTDAQNNIVDIITPVSKTVEVAEGNRVVVMIKNHSAVILGNVGNPATTTAYVDKATGAIKDTATNASKQVAEFMTVITERLDTDELVAEYGDISKLTASEILAEVINVNTDNVKTLNADTANINKALIKEVNAETGEIKYAKISELNAATADVKDLKAGVADINSLIFDGATGDTIHTNFSNSVIAQVGDAQIKSAMIQDIDAGKIKSGSIDTNKVNIQSDDGSFLIKDNRLQIKEGETVRVQIGKDGAGDYSVSICDKEGKVVFSENGVTGDGIPDNVIVNDMVADDANIHASKLNIDSLFEEINSDGTNVIKSTKVVVDEEGQTLEAAFKTISSLPGTVESQGVQIQANKSAIESKVWQQDINTAKNEMSTKYSSLEQTLSGFRTTVSETYTTKSEFDNLAIGGRNLVRDSRLNENTDSVPLSLSA